METSFFQIQGFLFNDTIKIINEKMNQFIKSYSFLHINEILDLTQNQEIVQNIKESKAIIINQYEDLNSKIEDRVFFVSFQKTIIIIKQTSISFLYPLFSNNSNLKFCFLSNTKSIFDQNITLNYKEVEISRNFNEEVTTFKQKLQIINKKGISIPPIFNTIINSILGFLIQQSYQKLTQNRIIYLSDQQNENSTVKETFDENDYVELRNIGMGSISAVYLIYHIEKGELFALKKPYTSDEENSKLYQREFNNYIRLNQHPLIAKYYGKTKESNYLIIEFINGSTLIEANNKQQLLLNDKFTIIFELMLIIDYLHRNNYIFRDLKPDNIIIDQDKTAVLIDLDRMIYCDEVDENNSTKDLSSCFMAPEVVNVGPFSYECDIYSIGKIINYLLNDLNDPEIQQIVADCTSIEPNKRPSIKSLIIEFYILYHSKIDIDNLFELNSSYFEEFFDFMTVLTLKNWGIDENNQDTQNFIGLMYYQGIDVEKNINKAIRYFELASKQNHLQATFYLGIIYSDGKYTQRNVERAIHYFQLSSDQGIPQASYQLGNIYEKGEGVKRDIKKAIEYFELAAKGNFPDAQYKLGLIYQTGKDVPININKSIYYLELAAKRNHQDAQLLLGIIYSNGKLIKRNSKKSIHYLTLSAEQNNSNAQFQLGYCYFYGINVRNNFQKAFYYFSEAAKQNHPEAQHNLGYMYYEGISTLRDIDKSIYYYSLAAEQNIIDSLIKLGDIYSNSVYANHDINKSIYYLSKASDLGDARAQHCLGVLYSDAQYNHIDIDKAIHYYLLASNQNYPQSQFNLAWHYDQAILFPRDIKKAIHFYTLAAKNHIIQAQYNLALIYYRGDFVPRDMDKALHYFYMASDNNFVEAHFLLGFIYSEGNYIQRDIEKSIHFYSLAAKYDHAIALNNLGAIYYFGKYVKRDIEKAIYYFTHAAKKGVKNSQFILGLIYLTNKYVQYDIDKSLHYFTLASNQNHAKAQFYLASIYSNGYFIQQNINIALHYFIQSSNNGYINSHFIIGFFYQEGKHVTRDILKSIRYYKEGSSFNNQYSKNNLGVIYKNGFGDLVVKNENIAIEYLKEAINQKNDVVSMLNLARIYMFNDNWKSKIDDTIELLTKASTENFLLPNILICLLMIKMHKNYLNVEIIKQEFGKFLIKEIDQFAYSIYQLINCLHLDKEDSFQYFYKLFENLDLIYDDQLNKIPYKIVMNQDLINEKPQDDLTMDFYEGFGILIS